jgi:hypothetical protein
MEALEQALSNTLRLASASSRSGTPFKKKN